MHTEKIAARVLFGAITLALAATAMFADLHGLVRLVPDDAFYYLEIARRAAMGQGSTFDGIHSTNGYHPLWLALLAPVGWIAQAERVVGVRVALLVGVALMAGAIVLVQRTAARLAPAEAALSTVWLSCTLLVSSVYGMEAPLAAFLAALLWWRVSGGWPDTVRGALALGALGAALILARLDAGFVVAGANAVWILRVNDRRARHGSTESWAPVLSALVLQIAVVCAYLGLNFAQFGVALPVRTVLEAARRPGPNLLWLSSLLAGLAVFSLLCGTFASAVAKRLPARDALWAAAIGTGVNLLILAASGGSETYNWHFTLPVLASGLYVPVLVEFLRERGWRLHAVAWATALALLALAAVGKSRSTGLAEKIARAEWLAIHAPADAVFAEADCGVLGYLSRRPFVNLDGLTSSPQFADALDDGKLDDWLARGGVNAIALPTSDPAPVGATATLRARGRRKAVIEATLEAWVPAASDERYTVWRIVDLAATGAPAAAVVQQ